MIYTIETPGIDGLCGVFTNKEILIQTIKKYFQTWRADPIKLKEFLKEIKSSDFEGGSIDAYELDEDLGGKDWMKIDENSYFFRSHEVYVDVWPNNSTRYFN
tara:strand:- start:16261 stop:16566 length:306 start_codon:yes stop_codon:yes gene_type:complete